MIEQPKQAHMSENIQDKIAKIQEQTDIKVNSYNIINSGADSLVLKINDEWIFRFPRETGSIQKMKDRLNFLIDFAPESTLQLPAPEYIGDDYIAYKKIPGNLLGPEAIKTLHEKDRQRIAAQLGLFLKTLHTFNSDNHNFQPGYHIMRPEDYEAAPKELRKFLTPEEFEELEARHKTIRENPDNFVNPTSIIHGDFNFNNILWNEESKDITGVIDWAEAGQGIPAMDFIGIADFNDPKNDNFLREILAAYGDENESLFNQIKQNSIIETMNWFWWYYKNNQEEGQKVWIDKLKKILNK